LVRPDRVGDPRGKTGRGSRVPAAAGGEECRNKVRPAGRPGGPGHVRADPHPSDLAGRNPGRAPDLTSTRCCSSPPPPPPGDVALSVMSCGRARAAFRHPSGGQGRTGCSMCSRVDGRRCAARTSRNDNLDCPARGRCSRVWSPIRARCRGNARQLVCRPVVRASSSSHPGRQRPRGHEPQRLRRLRWRRRGCVRSDAGAASRSRSGAGRSSVPHSVQGWTAGARYDRSQQNLPAGFCAGGRTPGGRGLAMGRWAGARRARPDVGDTVLAAARLGGLGRCALWP